MTYKARPTQSPLPHYNSNVFPSLALLLGLLEFNKPDMLPPETFLFPSSLDDATQTWKELAPSHLPCLHLNSLS